MSSNNSFIPILGPLQMFWFWLKNRRRAKALRAWATENGLQFAPDGKTFSPPPSPGHSEDASHLGKRSARATGIFARIIGMSKIQSTYPQFAANRLRGDWQSDKNICWGTYKGCTIVVWDTVFYDLNGGDADWTEGEYTSIMVLSDIPIHRMMITPNTLFKRLSAFGIEEGTGTFSMSTVKFELEEFNKAYRVKAKDQRWTYAVIDQSMMDWLLKMKKHTMEFAPGGVTISTWFTLDTDSIQRQLDFCIGFLERIPEDLKHHDLEGAQA